VRNPGSRRLEKPWAVFARHLHRGHRLLLNGFIDARDLLAFLVRHRIPVIKKTRFTAVKFPLLTHALPHLIVHRCSIIIIVHHRGAVRRARRLVKAHSHFLGNILKGFRH
jgi:hypothetical protein